MRGSHAGHAALLVQLGQAHRGTDARAHDAEEHLAPLQDVRKADRYPELKPHDLRHGVAVEVLEQRHDLEEVRALLGHARIDTTQIYTKIRPPQLKRAVAFYEDGAERLLSVEAASPAPRVSRTVDPGSRNIRMSLKSGSQKLNRIEVVAPTGFEPVFQP